MDARTRQQPRTGRHTPTRPDAAPDPGRTARAWTTTLAAARRAGEALQRGRTTLLTLGGFSALTGAAWTAAGTPAGLAAGGLSCLIVEYLSRGEGERK
ncbi:hypothetical protein RM572_00415 [Streptomyces sp. DSM 42041]|uniref:Uncharacterized protein n=1 Tax=Streptomyces hazeniae TaxID=3075538 RepID=A0ABU2NKH6_9ACTN|nr:hypothetical protein [Streptomyces sp. DSM 42041]MDT0377239.1 hypothetical protein [Streptomyces sp. DSM 42041]